MRYRRLGRTGLQVSEIGIGGGGLRCSTDDYAVEMIDRALELGVNYIDTATEYGDSETKVGIALRGRRKEAFVATKLDEVTAEGAKKELAESLGRLRMDYVDVLSLHGVQSVEDLDRRMAPGSVWEVLEQAKKDGTAHFLGVTGHRHDVLVEALRRDVFDMVLFIMNIAEQNATQELIPLALSKDIGMTVMKPLATGLLPSRLALRFLLTQPVSSVLPSASRMDWLEANLAVSDTPLPLTEEEKAEVERLRRELEHVRCRLCDFCMPCPKGIRISTLLGTYRFYNELRSMGWEKAQAFPWGEYTHQRLPKDVDIHLAAVPTCDACGECEPKCPYQLPIVEMLRGMMPGLRQLKALTETW
jgi:predicted aldo/keto reductase-like oxidoreductase